jgi:surface polysaccharide O-acyltransferase-like enzyme
MDLLPWYFNGIKNFEFVSWTGPLWFVEALLIFTLLFVFLFRPLSRFAPKISIKPTNFNVAILIGIITLVAFVVRLFYPIGTDITNLQIGFFSAYLFLFVAGILIHQSKIFEEITFRDGKKWLFISIGLGIPAWLLIIFFGGPINGIMLIEGGMNWPALFYAMWESFFCVTFIIALVGFFKHKVNISGKLQQFLSDNAFGVFVFHAPVLIGISMLLKDLSLHPILKFLLVSVLAVSASFGVAWIIRQVPVLRKIFS